MELIVRRGKWIGRFSPAGFIVWAVSRNRRRGWWTITPKVAEMVIKKTKSTTYRYLTMLVETGYVEVSGYTNNAVYKLSKG